MQAKDVHEQPIIDFLRRLGDCRPATHWRVNSDGRPDTGAPSIGDLPEMIGVPEKVLLAKLRSMKRRGLVDGCGCGCRGDWRLGEKERRAS